MYSIMPLYSTSQWTQDLLFDLAFLISSKRLRAILTLEQKEMTQQDNNLHLMPAGLVKTDWLRLYSSIFLSVVKWTDLRSFTMTK